MFLDSIFANKKMSMNTFMHPRNIYKQPPDFKSLALEYPEFAKFVKLELNGKVTLDFKDLKSFRALSTILLKKDFGLEVDMPLNKLIPTVPLRLNYILWIEDLLDFIGVKENAKGIDIGTGASCVYPLISARKNNWSMTATEIDDESISYAEKNVERNNLRHLVKVVKVNKDSFLQEIVKDGNPYDFTMCNPPFFGNTQELHPFFKSRKPDRPRPKNAFCASVNEVVASGGEVEFISTLARESKAYGSHVKIFTTMVGQIKHMPAIKKVLRELGVYSFCETEFCQGNTTRWGIAWTFSHFDLRKAPNLVKNLHKAKKIKPAFRYVIPVNEEVLPTVISHLEKLLLDLKMSIDDVTRMKNVHRYKVAAYSNTWSHQRRKKREKLKTQNNSDSSKDDSAVDMSSPQIDHELSPEDSESSPKTVENNNTIQGGPKSPGKRPLDSNLDGSFQKKLRISTEESNGEATVFFKFVLGVTAEEEGIAIELNNIDSETNREYLNQILLYIKNHLPDINSD